MTRGWTKEFGEWVKERRRAYGVAKTLPMTQGPFAAVLGISPSYLSSIERGLIPPAATITQLARRLGDDPADWLDAAGFAPEDRAPEEVSPVPEGSSLAAAVAAARHPLGMILSDGRVEYHTEVRTQMRYHAVAVVSDGVKGVLSGNDLVIMDSQADICLESLVLIRRGERCEIVRCVDVDGGEDGGVKVAAVPAKGRATTSRITRADVIGVAVYAVRPLQ